MIAAAVFIYNDEEKYINLDGLEEGFYTVFQNRGQQTFFYKVPDSKYFWLCGSCLLCCNYSAVVGQKQPLLLFK